MQLWRILVRHFFDAFDANVTQTLGILAVPGAFFVLVFQPLAFRGWDLVGVRFLFLSLSMVVVGIVAVLKWDALFPDKADYLILTPLPLRLSVLFLAKATALAILIALFLVDVNFLPMLFWPGIDTRPGTLSLFGSHILATAASGLFAALAIVTLQGFVLTLCGGRMLRRVSAAMQTLLMTLLVMMLFLSPLLGMNLKSLARQHSPLLYWVPGYWFAGFYERLRPAVNHPVLLGLGGFAMKALACTAALCALTYLAGYRRHARRVLESPEPAPAGAVSRWFAFRIDRLVLRNPLERAVFHFIGQTILRSSRHRLFLAVYAGFGASLAVLSYGSDQSGLLRLPLTLSFVLVSGLRAAFNFPSELRANWIFQSSESAGVEACAAAARKWVVVCGVAPLFLLFAPMEFANFAWTAALFHLAYGVALSVLLTEILFLGFHKVPFTCSYLAGKVNLVGLGVVYLLGFTMYSSTMARFEEWLAEWPVAGAAFFAVAAGSWFAIVRAGQSGDALEFEDLGEPEVRTLEIGA
jgi:hypothetical protein